MVKPDGQVTDLNLPVAWRSSPSIAVTSLSGVMIAFQDNTGRLSTWTETTVIGHPRLMMGGTSPSIVATQNDFVVAFQGSAGTLWWMHGSGEFVDIARPMSHGSSPATAFRPGCWITAVEARNGMLRVVTSSGVIEDLRLGMPL